MKKKRVLVLLSGSGKRNWFEKIQEGKIPETVLHAMRAIDSEDILLTYADERPFSVRLFFTFLTYDVLISSDTDARCFLAAMIRKGTFGLVGPRWILIAVNTSSVLKRLRMKPARLFLIKAFYKSCSKIVCLARSQMRDLETAGVRNERITFIPFGTDAGFFDDTASKKKEGTYVLSVGRDLARNYPLLLRAAAFLTHPVVIVASRKNIPTDAVIPPNVEIRYDISSIELRSLYADARLSVILTRDAAEPEGSDCSGQTVALEALATHTPLLMSPRPWMRDYFAEGVEYIPLDPTDPELIAQQIQALWDDQDTRVRIAAAGNQRFKLSYTTRIFAANLIELV